jgi:tRNA G18 (ribose-2'-O)-methylase SpoU
VSSTVPGTRAPCVQRVERIDDERVADYRVLRERELRTVPAGAGRFVAEGTLVVERLISSRYAVRSLFVREDRLAPLAPLLAGLPPATPVFTATREVFAGTGGLDFHQGVLAVGEEGPPRRPGELLERATRLVLLAGAINHDNVGGVFRDVAALAGERGAVLLDPRTADPLYRKSIRVSMGWALHVPFARLGTLAAGLELLRERGFRRLALSPFAGARDLGEVARERPERVALVLGSEGEGLDAATLEAADAVVRIPIEPGVDSLNLSVACGIALHALRP